VPTANPFSSSQAVQAEGDTDNPQTIRSIVRRLAGFEPGDGWVVSCYLKLEPRDRSRGKYQIKLKNRIKDRLAWLEEMGLPAADREVVSADLRRIREHLEEPGNLPVGRGVVLFASEPRDLFEAIPLPQVFRSRLAVDRGPLVRELAALDDEFGLVICTVYDRTAARFFRVTAFGVEEVSSIDAGDVVRAGRFRGNKGATNHGASGEHNFHRRIREEKHRHYATVAQQLFAMTRAAPIRGIVLAGVGADAAAVEPHLHPYLREQLLGVVRLNPKKVGHSDIMEAVFAVRREKEREWESEHVRQLQEGLGARWALNGVEPSLRALAHGQVRTLLVDPTFAEPGFRCRDSGRLTVRPSGCDGEGDGEQVPDVIDEAIEEALHQGCHVDVLEGDSSGVDGLAALLRFKPR
jgi:peptide chain release factor subunit 1